jgi:hypothetical protein
MTEENKEERKDSHHREAAEKGKKRNKLLRENKTKCNLSCEKCQS